MDSDWNGTDSKQNSSSNQFRCKACNKLYPSKEAKLRHIRKKHLFEATNGVRGDYPSLGSLTNLLIQKSQAPLVTDNYSDPSLDLPVIRK